MRCPGNSSTHPSHDRASCHYGDAPAAALRNTFPTEEHGGRSQEEEDGNYLLCRPVGHHSGCGSRLVI